MADSNLNLAATDADGKETTVPVPPEGQTQYAEGAPTTAPMARGQYANTALSVANDNRSHNCDVVAGLAKDAAILKSGIGKAIGAARSAVDALVASIETSPAAQDIKNEITAAQTKAAAIKQELAPQIAESQALQQYAAKMKALISEIQSAPAELQKVLATCLSEAQASYAETTAQLAAATKASAAAANTSAETTTTTG